MPDTAEQLRQLARDERRVAMATLIAARGGSPRPLGAKLFVGEGGRLLGSVSIGGCVDARVVEHGERLLRADRAERVTVVVDDVEAVELGLACGAEFDLLVEPVALDTDNTIVGAYNDVSRLSRAGETVLVVSAMGRGHVDRAVVVSGRVARGALPGGEGVLTQLDGVERSGLHALGGVEAFVERIAPPATLVLVGASDVGAALARFAHDLGFRVVVIDGRERYASRERFNVADELLVGMPSDLVRPFLRDGVYVVLAAHEYKYELPILREALRSRCARRCVTSGCWPAANDRTACAPCSRLTACRMMRSRDCTRRLAWTSEDASRRRSR
jgi:xanthine dehydrogenase accessory factor